MYDSYQNDQDSNFEILVGNTQKLGELAHEFIPQKKLWMTETTGAQWNGNDWHTYGWTADLTEHQKAIQAARYMHTTFVDAQANSFLWWGLIYSVAPDNEKNENVRQKHRDEGLVLVTAPANQVGDHQAFVERTKKFMSFHNTQSLFTPVTSGCTSTLYREYMHLPIWERTTIGSLPLSSTIPTPQGYLNASGCWI